MPYHLQSCDLNNFVYQNAYPNPRLQLAPTPLIPNSPKPLLLYKNCFFHNSDGKVDTALAYDTFKQNGWDAQWVTTYSRYQRSHYHPQTHEVMVPVSLRASSLIY
ncbi:hypothetical protein BDW74DRAFT_183010 [Aspergillus multicolor]|uniref:uncharacterized protein n=1 Tax=Aspergillus multicolor TaxID=41759 RepID=UPI003CCCF3AE